MRVIVLGLCANGGISCLIGMTTDEQVRSFVADAIASIRRDDPRWIEDRVWQDAERLSSKLIEVGGASRDSCRDRYAGSGVWPRNEHMFTESFPIDYP